MVFAAACGALALSTSARAEFFVGGAGGISDWPDAACSQAASSCDHRSGTWLVRGGYMFLPTWASRLATWISAAPRRAS